MHWRAQRLKLTLPLSSPALLPAATATLAYTCDPRLLPTLSLLLALRSPTTLADVAVQDALLPHLAARLVKSPLVPDALTPVLVAALSASPRPRRSLQGEGAEDSLPAHVGLALLTSVATTPGVPLAGLLPWIRVLVLALKPVAPAGVVRVLLLVGHQAPTMAVTCLEQLCVLLEGNAAIAAEGSDGWQSLTGKIIRELAHHWEEVPAAAVIGKTAERTEGDWKETRAETGRDWGDGVG